MIQIQLMIQEIIKQIINIESYIYIFIDQSNQWIEYYLLPFRLFGNKDWKRSDAQIYKEFPRQQKAI